jgi:ferric-dicitrate binding protein FerR (iron transport regulator)
VRDALQTYAPAPRPGRRHAARAYALFALLVAAYLAATIFQGVNWTDEGYHYALGQLLFSTARAARRPSSRWCTGSPSPCPAGGCA